MTMAPSCGECLFWLAHSPHDGTCRRSAPRPAESADEIAHWPMTVSRERCGDGVLRQDQQPVLISCRSCRFWHTNPGSGIDPQNRRGARREWWETAGHCVRHAPQPSPEPGSRGFWRATGGDDTCAEGLPPV